MYRIFTIIVAYNGEKLIRKCLNSLKESHIPTEIIVVDNHSVDCTREIIRKEYPKVRLIVSSENLGFGRANNIGFSIALKEKANYVFLLNQDAWINPETISGLMEISKNKSAFGVLSPVHLSGNGYELDKAFAVYLSPPSCFNYINDLHFNRKSEIYEVPFINAACWLIPDTTLKYVGGFDPLFFHYGEDKDYCNRLLKKNFKIGVCTSVHVYHERVHCYKDEKYLEKKVLISKEYARVIEYLKSSKNIPMAFIKMFIRKVKDIIKNTFGLKFNKISMDLHILLKIISIRKTLIKNVRKEKEYYNTYIDLNPKNMF